MQLLLQKPLMPTDLANHDQWMRFEIGKLIAKTTGGPFCHSEIRFRDGRSFSSDAPDGVRFLDADAIGLLLRNHREAWKIVELPPAWEETPALLRWCEQEVGCEYDYIGAFNSGIGTAWEDSKKWFCSEICGEVLSRASGLPIPKLLCPNALDQWIGGVLCGETYEELQYLLPDPPCEAKRLFARLALNAASCHKALSKGACPCGDL